MSDLRPVPFPPLPRAARPCPPALPALPAAGPPGLHRDHAGRRRACPTSGPGALGRLLAGLYRARTCHRWREEGRGARPRGPRGPSDETRAASSEAARGALPPARPRPGSLAGGPSSSKAGGGLSPSGHQRAQGRLPGRAPFRPWLAVGVPLSWSRSSERPVGPSQARWQRRKREREPPSLGAPARRPPTASRDTCPAGPLKKKKNTHTQSCAGRPRPRVCTAPPAARRTARPRPPPRTSPRGLPGPPSRPRAPTEPTPRGRAAGGAPRPPAGIRGAEGSPGPPATLHAGLGLGEARRPVQTR